MRRTLITLLLAAMPIVALPANGQVPPALGELTVRAGDSALVAAAKRATAARLHPAGHTVWVIDDAMVGHRIVTAEGGAPQRGSGGRAWGEAPATFSSHDGSGERRQRETARGELQHEQQRMAEESEQPYGGDVSEDLVEKRMTEIPAQLEKIPPP